jgi:soluble lytic murein transglycosylase-like protein
MLLLAQDADSIRAAMSPGLEKQRTSIANQIKSTPEAGFFSLSWPALPVVASALDDPICDPVAPEQLSTLIDQAAQRESVEANLIRAVIKKESGGRACAVSPKGAKGVMQLMPDTATELGVADVLDPKQNIDAGVKLLKSLLTKYAGDVSLALAAYNAGSAAVDKDHAIPKIPETVNYVSDILEELTKKKP